MSCVTVCVIFHSYGDVTITDEGLQILTYTRHSWPMSSEGSWACSTYCDTGRPFKMVISEDPSHSHLLPSVWHGSWYMCTTCFYDLGLSWIGFEHPTYGLSGERSNRLRHHGGFTRICKQRKQLLIILLKWSKNTLYIVQKIANCITRIKHFFRKKKTNKWRE